QTNSPEGFYMAPGFAASRPSEAAAVGGTQQATLTGIAVETQPNLTYNVTDKLDLSLLSVTLTYSDGSAQTAAYADFAENGITLTYSGGSPAADGDILKIAQNGMTLVATCGGLTAETGALVVTIIAAYDINGDGKVDSADLALIMANLNKKASTNAVTKKCDVDGNGIVDMNDYALVAAYIAAAQ
ncbi:MAG: dockerin type I domain-containing protein, partial [Defluviitaleaceae bacterium]|nr:dockerin type I domain-containing protein [Defluviitaleaceae bacterium]